MAGTDSGTGTADQLTDPQLTLALYAASNRVSVYAGNLYDSSVPEAVPPGILHDLTLDLACFWAAKTYLKWKTVEPTSPTFIAYQNAMSILADVRAGKVQHCLAHGLGGDGAGVDAHAPNHGASLNHHHTLAHLGSSHGRALPRRPGTDHDQVILLRAHANLSPVGYC